MGAFAYCRHRDCDVGVNAPTIFEVVYQTWECRNGHRQEITDEHRGQVLLDLDEKIEELTKRVIALEPKPA